MCKNATEWSQFQLKQEDIDDSVCVGISLYFSSQEDKESSMKINELIKT